MAVSFKVIIPARYASSRFPGKALVDIAGKSMLQRVFERACQSGAEQVVVATDDERIRQAAKEFGATVCMTSVSHVSGSDRLAEVVSIYKWSDETIVVNVQGDEPLIPPENINQVAMNIAEHPQAAIATLVTRFDNVEELQSADNVKVVTDHEGYALYFSRAMIPYDRDAQAVVEYRRHVGLYAYRAGYLKEFTKLQPSPIELQEKLEQLRALWYGWKIHVAVAIKKPLPGVDTPEDLKYLLELLNRNSV
ncbi:MAG: 3-deoxy-manno-octulosonate cytidylyltransferase [Gammaproteobacteria bacterium]|nr:3-deoxy-manno-octulosonate cytidylyltransferase [Gammaproteobacteria bacterium]